MFTPVMTAQSSMQAAVNAYAVAPSAVPSLGNLPQQVVSAPIQTVKVADNRPSTSYARSAAVETPAPSSANAAALGGEYNDVYLDFPYSSSFVAQLFGQLNMDAGNGATSFVDYETLSQYEEIKYKPSFAFRPQDSLMANLREQQKTFMEGVSVDEQEAAPAQMAQSSPAVAQNPAQPQTTGQPSREPMNPSLYSEGVFAYSAVESRNVMGVSSAAAAQGNMQISAFV